MMIITNLKISCPQNLSLDISLENAYFKLNYTKHYSV